MKVFGAVVALVIAATAPAFAQAQEQEPNENPATATPATRGGSIRATIGPYNQATGELDVDYYKITANAGDTIFVDIDANEFGSPMDMGLKLYASDGTTVVASNSDWDGMDPHLTYVATTTGTYYVLASAGPQGTAKPYTIHFFEVKCPANDAESNDSPATATHATVGQTMQASSCPGTDVDFFRFELDPGTYEFNFVMDPHERPENGAEPIAGWIELYDADGTTKLAATDAWRTPDRIKYTARTRGTYYIRAEITPGGIRYTYTLSSKKIMSGAVAGDPITVRAELVGFYWDFSGTAVDPNGDILVSGRTMWRITPQGNTTNVNTGVEDPAGLAWDADRNLLIVSAAGVYATSSTSGGVFKYANGQATRLITDNRADGGIAMAADGSFWLSSWSAKALLHYSAQGTLLSVYDATASSDTWGPRYVAIGPSGDPYFSTAQDLYRLRNGVAEHIIHYDPTPTDIPALDIGAFAFDVQGNIYVPNGAAGVVNLHDINGKWLETISYETTAPVRVFFGRYSDGSMNARLFGLDNGKLIEFNPAGVRAAGLPVQFERQQAPAMPTLAQAIAELLRPGSLSTTQLQQLDQQGNSNGRYDVGDLRALLVRSGTVATIPRATP